MTDSLDKIIDSVCKNIFPRNMVAICNELGIKVKESYDLENDVSGLIYKENDKYIILVNGFHSPTRQNFTIAHELGHYYKHREKLDNDSEIVSYIKSRNIDCPAIPRGNTMLHDKEYNKIEKEANDFAANILMPKHEFIEQCCNSNSIEDVANHFGVSVSAASVRANILGGWFFL